MAPRLTLIKIGPKGASCQIWCFCPHVTVILKYDTKLAHYKPVAHSEIKRKYKNNFSFISEHDKLYSHTNDRRSCFNDCRSI